MSDIKPDEPTLRLWPGVIAVILQWLTRFGLPAFVPDTTQYGVFGALLGGLAVIVWWSFFSRAPKPERWSAVALMIFGIAATPYLAHESIATSMMGMMVVVYATPIMCLAFVGWALVSHRLAAGFRRATMAASILLSCGVLTLLRTGGFSSDLNHDFAWRWAETPEERLLAQTADEPIISTSAPVRTATGAHWPGFRGRHRDGVMHGTTIATDWSDQPPVELWRRPVGPGWSSFAVSGDLFYTQEQRGDNEVVTCYNATTGEPVWRHGDDARFWESNAGAGPRGTPTLGDGRLFTFGATGILNALNAREGTPLWSRNAASDTDTPIPGWGFSSSPLLVDDLVIVAVSGVLAAYEQATGEPRWYGPDGGHGYSSPHLVSIDHVAQILLSRGNEIISVAPADGKLLWKHPLPPGTSIVQPALTADGDLLLSDGETTGIRRIAVSLGSNGWAVKERWTSIRLKPYFSDFVVHEGHAFGVDGSILACIDTETGKRKWKGGRYGSGQMILLADQDLLLVLSEQGELALVAAATDQFTELARYPAIEGKTWNHPVLADDILLVRNSEEMAAFRLILAGD